MNYPVGKSDFVGRVLILQYEIFRDIPMKEAV